MPTGSGDVRFLGKTGSSPPMAKTTRLSPERHQAARNDAMTLRSEMDVLSCAERAGREPHRHETTRICRLIGGAAALWSLAAKAQGKVPVIGYLHFATPDYQPAAASFLKGLAETGFIEGKDFSVAYRWAEGHYDSLPAMASELVALEVDLIAAFGPPPAKAAKAATSTIPIVFEVGNDAVEAGLVESLARPGGNATGLNILFTQLTAKRLEVLCQLLPYQSKESNGRALHSRCSSRRSLQRRATFDPERQQ
jgi:hypothetical protein